MKRLTARHPALATWTAVCSMVAAVLSAGRVL